jgi:hypothetical protein
MAAIVCLALVYLPVVLSAVPGPARVAGPVFPSTIARYSWYTGMLSTDRFPAASLLYQNGVGVEFLDTPQSVLLSTDGSTYRRLDEAEALSIPEDQGDPAVSVLSADGTFVVVASAGRAGEVQVVTVGDGRRRSMPVGNGRTALPVSISSDGRTVLLTTSNGVVDRYAETEDLGLARLDLQTGRVLDYPGVTGVRAAALSPDGSRIVVTTARGVELIDATTGRVTATVDGSTEMTLDGDAWSADGRLVALAQRSALVIVDVAGAKPVRRDLRLREVEHAAAIGWRDRSTVLVHGVTDGYQNTSQLYWVDATTGEQEAFASYTPNVTGASLLRADAARDLVPRWRVTDRPVDRGPLPLPLGILLAAVAGLGAAGVASVVGRSVGRRRGPRGSSLGRKATGPRPADQAPPPSP